MDAIFHVARRTEWENSPADSYVPAAFATEGFIHLSQSHQVFRIFQRFATELDQYVLIEVDPEKLAAPLRMEGSPEAYPHLYGSLNKTAVISVHPLPLQPCKKPQVE